MSSPAADFPSPPSPARLAGRGGTYRDYLRGLGPASARRVLLGLVLCLLAAEVGLRLAPPRYGRTAISSLHGVRAIMQQALEDGGRKIIAVGDSTLAGGGVARDDRTVAGRWQDSLPAGTRLYNLAAPGGDTTTSLLLLDALRQEKIAGVERVVIEVLPGKFFTDEKTDTTPNDAAVASIEELRRYIPDARPDAWGLPGKSPAPGERAERRAQWDLGRASALYRHRDFFRTDLTGNYPIYWLIGRTLPRSLMARLFPAKAQGTNRLAARSDDFPYDPAAVPASGGGGRVRFTPHAQGDYLEKCLEVAREISPRPPVILAFPIHYEYSHPDDAERASLLAAFGACDDYLTQLARRTGSELITVRSEPLQDPRWWTRSSAHFNAEGSARVWQAIEPQARALTAPAPAR